MIHPRTLLLSVTKLLVSVLMVLLVAGVLVACGNPTSSKGGDDDGHLGLQFTIPGGAIGGDTLPGDGTLTVHAYFVHVLTDGETEVFSISKAHVTVADSIMSSLEIQGTPTTDGTWDWLADEEVPMEPDNTQFARLHIILHTTNHSGNPYSDGTGRVYRAAADDTTRVDYWYVDRDVVIGEASSDEALSLTTGWNRIIMMGEGESTVFSTGDEPADVEWIYDEP